jgi:hypothetical protein
MFLHSLLFTTTHCELLIHVDGGHQHAQVTLKHRDFKMLARRDLVAQAKCHTLDEA